MRDSFSSERTQESVFSRFRDECYDDKQANYDYNGSIPQNEDRADWYKSPLRVLNIIR